MVEDPERKRPDFSICVATYNRAALLQDFVARIGKLDGASFELVIVDDGSPDDTAAELERLAAAASFPLRWETIPHAGRGSALNRALDLASGEFIYLLDDDDLIPDGALADILATWESIPEVERPGFCGVCGLAARPDGTIIGKRFPGDGLDGDFFNVRIVGRVRGDKREVVLREAIGNWRFPVVPGEFRVATSILWFTLAARYKMRFVNRVWLVKVYRPDGLTANGLRNKVTSPNLTAILHETALKLFPDMPWYLRGKYLMGFMRFGGHAGMSAPERLSQVGASPLSLLALLIGEAGRIRDRSRIAKRARQTGGETS